MEEFFIEDSRLLFFFPQKKIGEAAAFFDQVHLTAARASGASVMILSVPQRAILI
jgi:hypothetical protein